MSTLVLSLSFSSSGGATLRSNCSCAFVDGWGLSVFGEGYGGSFCFRALCLGLFRFDVGGKGEVGIPIGEFELDPV